ncbi:MAG: 4,5-DOPA dioxygenase extradiol [Pseudomonadota bacterium]
MPDIFIGHGSPMNALSDNIYTQAWAAFGASVPRPQAILAISAHWLTRGTAVTAMARPRTIHEFNDFPQRLLDIQYPAAGSIELAHRVQTLLTPIDVTLDQDWGLDYGSWAVLCKVFPLADIAVVQLSIDATQAPAYHFMLGQKLAALRDQGVVIIASGNVVHNLGLLVSREGAPAFDWASRFNQVVRSGVLNQDFESLVNFDKHGEDARLSIPTTDHYLPLLYILGAVQDDDAVSIPIDGIENSSISMLSVLVNQAASL